MVSLSEFSRFSRSPIFVALLFALVSAPSVRGQGMPKVPPEFEVRLVAAVPAVLYPSQTATGPGGLLFVGEDPMDQPGPTSEPLDRILLFRDGQEPVVFAEKLYAVFGMVYREGALYVMNMPHLTVLRDTDGDGKADQRKDLFTDLGVPAGSPNNLNDHIVSGLQFGIDGRLYIAVGDKGVPGATGPDGRKVQLKGGGILRCLPDGRELEVYSSGTRNHLEPNLDDRDNLFTYDNTDDGDGWWTRVTHHINTGYYGYPYDYHKYAYRFLNRLAEYGGGSPCGGVVYSEDAWPEEYRGRAFWAEWGKRQVAMATFKPKGASFEVEQMKDFASPGESGEFRPIDLALSYDGKTLYVADWGTGGWGKKDEKVGRVYAITYKGQAPTQPRGADSDPIASQIAALRHPSLNERTRAQRALVRLGKVALTAVTAATENPGTSALALRHLVWTLDGIAGGAPEATIPTIALLKSPHADVRAQAARALGMRSAAIATQPLLSLLKDREPTVRLQAIIALGRIGDIKAVQPLAPILADDDPYLAFAARQAIRALGDYKTLGSILASASEPKLREKILETLELQYDVDAVKLLAKEALDAKKAEDRARAVAFSATVHHKPAPWDGKWWGTRPTQGRPPAKEIAWPGTEIVLKTLRGALKDRSAAVRLAAVEGTIESADQAALTTLKKMFASEPDAKVKAGIALAFGVLKDQSAVKTLTSALRDAKVDESVRDAAIESLEKLGGEVAAKALLDLLNQRDLSAARRPKVIRALAKLKVEDAGATIRANLSSDDATVRAASAEALGKLKPSKPAVEALIARFEDKSAAVRKAAIAATGELGDRSAIDPLIAVAGKNTNRFDATVALAKMPDMKALGIYVQGLESRNPQQRRLCSRAIAELRDQAAPVLDQLAQRHELSSLAATELKTVFRDLQPLIQWRVVGPLPENAPAPIERNAAPDFRAELTSVKGAQVHWKPLRGNPTTGEVDLDAAFDDGAGQAAFGYAEYVANQAKSAKLILGSDDTLTVWLNGRQVFAYNDSRGYEPNQNTIDVSLAAGVNRILIKCGNHGGVWRYSAAVSAPMEYAFLKAAESSEFDPRAYRDFALRRDGDKAKGKTLFSDLKGLACLKCHAVGSEGGKVGPELSGVGLKYSKQDLIESVLYPSAKISSGYEPSVLATADGRVITGIIKSENPKSIEIEDAEAKRITIEKDEIEERKPSAVSLMPSGLAEGLKPADFADLIAYLQSLREAKPAGK